MIETVYYLKTPVSIAVVADLHARSYHHVLESLQQHRPELICMPGDLFLGHRPSDTIPVCLIYDGMLPFFRACARIAPSFLSLGNHEWMLTPRDFELIRDAGVQVLDNSWTSCGELSIGGLTSANVAEFRQSYQESEKNIPKRRFFQKRDAEPVPELSWLDEFETTPGFRILLSHHPEYYPKYLLGRQIDLILSGHAHGGQIRLFHRGLFAPGQGMFPKYTSGIHDNLVVSRGLANTGGVVPRLFNPPELVYLFNPDN